MLEALGLLWSGAFYFCRISDLFHIPKGAWTIFDNEPHEISEPSKKLDELTARIYSDWLPTVDYKLEGCNFEMYYNKEGKFYEERWFKIK